MFGSAGYGYEPLQQRETTTKDTPGLFVSDPHRGLSFDHVPSVSQQDFRDTSQGWLSRICHLIVIFLVHIVTFITFPISGWFVFKTVLNYEKIVVFRLGRICSPKGPGVVLVLPLIDQWQRVDLRTRAFNIPPCQVRTLDGGLLLVGADIQFRIWNPVLSVVAVQDLNASTRMTAHKALSYSLSRRTVREIQCERVKLGEYLGMDINEMTKPWGLEVDRVELVIGSTSKTEEAPQAPFIVPPSVPGMEGLAGPIQQLAMHFFSQSQPQPKLEDTVTVTVTDELAPGPSPHSVEELLNAVRLLLSESLVSRVQACFQFYISSADKQQHSYYVDLRRGSGAAGTGSSPDPDVTLSLTDTDLQALFEGTLRPFAAYSSGRLRIQGDVKTAMKLEEVIQLLRK
ncbi:stomatin-like protein 1 [Eucyclogobius newberryi]|uniref:stomatin-like protein 1 n=1 Tax=Eucyclogobius newberryi TaxID=166745 RepID=UPI003B5BAB08